jgi:hypothetical protein
LERTLSSGSVYWIISPTIQIIRIHSRPAYRLEALRPGTYRLTFTIAGFSTVVRDNINVPSEVVVTINADMKVGALEETITVSGQAAQVDVQQASRTQLITRDVIDALPVSRNMTSIGVLAPNVHQSTPDISSSRMTEQVGLRAHGLRGDDASNSSKGRRSKASREPRRVFRVIETATSETLCMCSRSVRQ